MTLHSLLLSFIFILTALLPPTEAPEVLPLRLTRDIGYGGINGEIEGRFSMRVGEIEGLAEVRYYLDDDIVHVSNGPDNFTFETGSFPAGSHSLTAVGVLVDGREIPGPVFERTFLTSDEVSGKVRGLVVPIIVLIAVVTVATALVPVLMSRIKPVNMVWRAVRFAHAARCLIPATCWHPICLPAN